MSSPQDKYTDAMRQGQQAMTEAVETWTESAQKAMGCDAHHDRERSPPQQVIDQVFDFAEKMLQAQREFAKNMATTAASASESARQHSESVADAVRTSTPSSPPRSCRTRSPRSSRRRPDPKACRCSAIRSRAEFIDPTAALADPRAHPPVDRDLEGPT